jgi:hypothetical protein
MLASVWTLVSVPAGNDRGPLYMEQAFAALHAANPRRLPLRLAFVRSGGRVGLGVAFPPELRTAIETQLAAAYPDAALARTADVRLDVPAGHAVWWTDLRLSPDIFPIRRHPQFEDAANRAVADPLTGILATLAASARERLMPSVEIIARPAGRGRLRGARNALRSLASPSLQRRPGRARLFARLAASRCRAARLAAWLLGRRSRRRGRAPTVSSPRTHDREDDLQAAADKLGRHLFEAHLRITVVAPRESGDAARHRLREIAGAFGQFGSPRLAAFRGDRTRRSRRRPRPPRGRGFLLSAQELATLWHPPTSTVRAPTMATVESREREPPVDLPLLADDPGLAALGRVRFRRRSEVFGIRPEDRRRHVAVIGKTGMGKSTLLLNLLSSDIRAGRGAGLIDPHGDLAEAVLAAVPAGRTNDVVLFDAGDRAFPLAYNPLACALIEDRPLVASGVLSAFKKLYGASWGPRLEHILRNALLAVLEDERPNLLSVQRLLSDAAYRARLTRRLADPMVRAFWQQEFARWNDRFRSEAVAPIQNKLGHFLSQPLLRAIVGQDRRSLDLRAVMDRGQVLLVNLSKGRVGDDASALLGAILVTGIQLAAMGRAEVPERERRDFFLYVDEFQNFATEAFPTILSEARKYGLSLTLANQYLAQMDEGTRSAVFGNVGSLLVFQAGAEDAEILARQLGGDLTDQDVLTLPKYRAYARLLVAGQPSRPFSFETLPPSQNRDTRRVEIIRHTSQHRYGRPVREVELELAGHFNVAA